MGLNLKIKDKMIGKDEPCFIIAEAGVNHNGKLDQALKLVDAASAANADAVKFQAYKTEELVINGLEMAEYQKTNIGRDISQFEMLKQYELTLDDFYKIKDYCDEKNIIFLCTIHSNSDLLESMDKILPAYKIGSGDLNNFIFLEEVARKKKPMIIGTGMGSMDEILEVEKFLKSKGNDQLIFLHATTNYPCDIYNVNLNLLKKMQDKLSSLVGYSDHTIGLMVPMLAVSLGAVVLEKHFTLDKSLPGPDHRASLNPEELKEMVHSIIDVELALGNEDVEKIPLKSELNIKKIVRKSIVANVDIKKGTTIDKNMLSIKRPGIGLPPKKFQSIIGKKAVKDIKKDQLLREDMYE